MNVRRFGLWFNLCVGALLMLVVWALFVWVASRPALRMLIDLTPQQVNSVDPVTEELLRELRKQGAQVEFHLFTQPIGGRVQDANQAQRIEIRRRVVDLTRLLMRRYVAIGGESVTFREHSPYRDTASFRAAKDEFGYSAADNEALVVAVTQKDKERRHRKLSLLTDMAEIEVPRPQPGPARRDTVPRLIGYEGEKAISSALKGLLVQGTPVVYVLRGYSTGVDFGEHQADYGALVTALQTGGFEIKELKFGQSARVPADAAMVMCLEPRREFEPRTAEALYEYLKRGGRLFVNYVYSHAAADFNPTGGRLGELLGYELSDGPVYHKIPDIAGQTGHSLDGTDAVARLRLMLNGVHPTTRRIAESGRPMEVMFGRELRVRKDAPQDVRHEPLVRTGPEGWLAIRGPDGRYGNRAPGVGLRPFLLGLACEVDVDGGTDGGADGDRPDGQPRTGQAVIVSGFFCNNAGMEYFGDLALNICNWMAERRVLIDIRGGRYEADELEFKLQNQQRIDALLTFYVPGAFLLLGLIMWWRRRH